MSNIGPDLKEKWENCKKEALKVLPTGFFTGADLGKLLGKAQDAHKVYDKLPGTTDHAKLQSAKRAANAAYTEAGNACSVYMKLVSMAEKSSGNKGNAPLLGALSKAGTVLAFDIKKGIEGRLKSL